MKIKKETQIKILTTIVMVFVMLFFSLLVFRHKVADFIYDYADNYFYSNSEIENGIFCYKVVDFLYSDDKSSERIFRLTSMGQVLKSNVESGSLVKPARQLCLKMMIRFLRESIEWGEEKDYLSTDEYIDLAWALLRLRKEKEALEIFNRACKGCSYEEKIQILCGKGKAFFPISESKGLAAYNEALVACKAEDYYNKASIQYDISKQYCKKDTDKQLKHLWKANAIFRQKKNH